jgi:hypothetical protein
MEIELKGKKERNKVGKELLEARKSSFWQGETAAELARKQGVQPIKDTRDLARLTGGLEDWDDVDEFLREMRGA